MKVNTRALTVPGAVLLLSVAAWAQSFTITSPTANQAISGFLGFSFSGTASNAPGAYCVIWQIDAYVPVGSGCVRFPYAYSYNTFFSQNGNHVLTATLKDARGNTLASATQNFSIANTWPVNPVNTGVPSGMSVATSTALTSNWSGSVSITPTFTGESATHCKNVTWFVDGNAVNILSNPCTTSASPSFSLDTTKFYNGSHLIALNGTDTTGGITYAGDNTYIGGITEWSATVTFANTATIPVEARPNYREVFIAPGGTFQYSATLYDVNGSPDASQPNFVYNSENPSMATVTSAGLVTAGTPTAFNPAMSKIDVMAPLVSGTDLKCTNASLNCVGGYQSLAHPVTQGMNGQMIVVSAGTGWTLGTYYISNASIANNTFTLQTCTVYSCVNANPGVTSNPGTFRTGPTETSFVMVTASAPNPPIYHFDCTNGAILSTYTAGHSCMALSGFGSILSVPYTASGVGGTDQVYNPGFLSDYVSAGFNTLEAGAPLAPNASTSENNYVTNTLTPLVSSFQTYFGATGIKLNLQWDAWLKQQGNTGGSFGSSSGMGLFQTTRAIYSPAWSITPFTHVLNAFAGLALYSQAGDEYSNLGNDPFQAPITFSNGIASIVATGGGGPTESCALTPSALNSGAGNFVLPNIAPHRFVITGSSIANMNTPPGVYFTAPGANPPFTFTCPNVPDGTYNASNDPGLNLEPYAFVWLNNTTGTTTSPNDYVHNDVFHNIRAQIVAATPSHPAFTFPAIGTAGCVQIYGFENSSYGLSDYAVKYITANANNYLQSYTGIKGNVGTDLNTSNLGILNVLRDTFGCYSPTAPLVNQGSGTPVGYGLQGYSPGATSTGVSVSNVATFTGSTITLNTPHGLTQIYPGITRLTLSNMSNSADNKNYYVIAWPNATTLTVANEVTDFTATNLTLSAGIGSTDTTFTISDASAFDTAPYIVSIGGDAGELVSCTTLVTNTFSGCTRGITGGTGAASHGSGSRINLGGGTITFQNGDTKPARVWWISGANTCSNAGFTIGNVCGDVFTYQGSTDQTILNHRGMTFTVSGTSSSILNSRTFIYSTENSGPVAAAYGNHYRELPQGSSTSGTVTIIADQSVVPGRQGLYPQSFRDPDFIFSALLPGFYARGAGVRQYSFTFNQNGYGQYGGILGNGTNLPTRFNDTCVNGGSSCGSQLFLHPHWQSHFQSVDYWAAGMANILHQRLAPFWLTTSLNSPSYGANWECTARSGARGQSLGCWNTTNAPQTMTFTLTPYLQSGQQIGQFIANSQAILFSTLAANTNTATVTVPMGGEVVFVFPVNFAGEFEQPTISLRLADIPNAAAVVVEYGYEQFLLDTGFTTVDCGTGGACVLPVDRNIGPVYYRILYLNSSGAPIATGDVETL